MRRVFSFLLVAVLLVSFIPSALAGNALSEKQKKAIQNEMDGGFWTAHIDSGGALADFDYAFNNGSFGFHSYFEIEKTGMVVWDTVVFGTYQIEENRIVLSFENDDNTSSTKTLAYEYKDGHLTIWLSEDTSDKDNVLTRNPYYKGYDDVEELAQTEFSKKGKSLLLAECPSTVKSIEMITTGTTDTAYNAKKYSITATIHGYFFANNAYGENLGKYYFDYAYTYNLNNGKSSTVVKVFKNN